MDWRAYESTPAPLAAFAVHDLETCTDLDSEIPPLLLVLFVFPFRYVPFWSKDSRWVKDLSLQLGVCCPSEEDWREHRRGGREMCHTRCGLNISYTARLLVIDRAYS
jgi:hypothetical protein